MVGVCGVSEKRGENAYIPEYFFWIYQHQYSLYLIGIAIIIAGALFHRRWFGSLLMEMTSTAIMIVGITIIIFTYGTVYKMDKEFQNRDLWMK